MFIVAYDFNGVLVTHSVPARNRVNGAYYSYFLEHHLRSAVCCKCPNLLNSHSIVLHYVARTLITAPVVNLFRRWNWEILEHPPYSPDMSPCDFDLLTKMKLPLRVVQFRTRQAITAAVEQSIKILVQQDAVDASVVSLMCGGGFFILEEITSDH